MTHRATPGGLCSSSAPLCQTYDVGLLDLDGVIYVGADAVPHAAESLTAAARDGMRFAFVTNNAARTPQSVAHHLVELSIPATAEQVVTSAQAAATMIAELVEPGAPVLVVGGDGLEQALLERGLVPVHSADDEPVAVVQGFSPDVGWRQLTEGALALATGVPWVASNLDLTIPTARGRAPGNGTLVNVLRQATGRTPQVAGKPELPLHAEAVRRSSATRPLVVGDRLDTDIEGAVRAGTDSLLVMTGVTSAADAVCASPMLRPTYVGADLRALLEAHVAPSLDGGTARSGAWNAAVQQGLLHLWAAQERADPTDAVRAACTAVWSAADAPEDDQVRHELERVGVR